jgi:alpha-D-ribose 1-methylphosphonate 5-triphosphate diphosphatase
MREQIFTNADVALPDRVLRGGSICIHDDRIAAVDGGRSAAPGAVDCEGDLIVPGLIELHTDNLERHVMPRPNAYWPVDAAVVNHDREVASAGITTVFNALCVGEVHSRSMRLRYLDEMSEAIGSRQADGDLKAEHFLHWRCEISYGGLLDLLEPLMGHERVRLVSVMDHTPGQRQFADIAKYAEYYLGKFNMSPEELDAFMAERTEDQQLHSERNRAAVVAMARARGCALASHDDATVEHVREAARDSMVIAEFPTTVEAARACHEVGMAVMMGGPNIVRGGSHSGNVAALDLAGLGVLDIISSDYVPASLLCGALRLAEAVDGLGLPEAVAMVTRNPARAVGLDDRGEIAAGLRADFVRVKQAKRTPIVREVWRQGARIA